MPQESLQVAFLVRARGMILLEFYLVLKNVFALSACKLNEQKRPAEVFGHGNEGAFLRQQATCLCGSDTSGQIQFFSRLHKSLRWLHFCPVRSAADRGRSRRQQRAS